VNQTNTEILVLSRARLTFSLPGGRFAHQPGRQLRHWSSITKKCSQCTSLISYITGVAKLRLASCMRLFELSEKLYIFFLFLLKSVEIL